MFYQDGICFFEESDVLSSSGVGVEDHFMPFDPMATQNKQPETDWYSNSYYQVQGQQYESLYDGYPVDQNDLVAMPSCFPNELENTYVDADLQYLQPRMSSVSESVQRPVSTRPVRESEVPAQIRAAPATTAKKRKASAESLRVEAPVAKRVAVAVRDAAYDNVDFLSESSQYSSLLPTPATVPQLYHNHKLGGSPKINRHQHTISNVSQATMAMPYTPSASPAYTHANTEHSPQVPLTPVARPISAISNPKLVRTSTIHHQSPQVSQTVPQDVHQENQSYSGFDGKVVLHINGDIEDVGKNWSDLELEDGRKILVFSREQQGNDVYLSFKTMTQAEWNNAPYSISCIWWADRNEAYVTSVDTIQLLELIVGNRFTVEEKNRIRRNLEGFKPETICKGKPDKPESEEFFKIIMGFPNPKPRNIEKDVKAFPWRVLSNALHKIVSKYSASYNPTTAQNRLYRTAEQLLQSYQFDVATGYEHRAAPQLASFDSYQRGTMSTPGTPSVAMHMPHMVQPTQAMVPQYSVVPAPLHQQHYLPSQYVPQQVPVYDHHQQYTAGLMNAPMSAPLTQAPYWPTQQYVEAPMYAPPASAPSTAYPRDMIETTDYSGVTYNVQPPPRVAYR